MRDLTTAVEAAAQVMWNHTQLGRMDPGRLGEDGRPLRWADLNESHRGAFRELALPIVVAAVRAYEDTHDV